MTLQIDDEPPAPSSYGMRGASRGVALDRLGAFPLGSETETHEWQQSCYHFAQEQNPAHPLAYSAQEEREADNGLLVS